MTPTFLSDQFDAMYYVPSYRAWFFRQDLRPAYEYHRRFLQHLQFRRAARRWILKAPTHMFAMPALLSVYPDALFVQTHRTPVDAMASVSSLVTILRSAFSDAVDPFTVCREAIDYWSETMNKFLPERDRLADNRICDIQYDEIRREPIRRSSANLRIFRLVIVSGSRATHARTRCEPGRETIREPPIRSIAVWFLGRRSAQCVRDILPAIWFSSAKRCAAEASSAVGRLIRCRRNNSRMTFEAIRLIRADHPSLPGHFPGAPLVPGVVILDEVIAALVEWRENSQLTGIRMVKFLAPLKPEQAFTISLSAEK